MSIYLDPLLVSAGDGGFAFWCWTWEITAEMLWPRLGISEGVGSLEGIGASLVRSKQRLWAASVRCLRNCSSKLLSSWKKKTHHYPVLLIATTNAQWIIITKRTSSEWKSSSLEWGMELLGEDGDLILVVWISLSLSTAAKSSWLKEKKVHQNQIVHVTRKDHEYTWEDLWGQRIASK